MSTAIGRFKASALALGVALVLGTVSTGASAADTRAMEKRLEQMEAMMKSLLAEQAALKQELAEQKAIAQQAQASSAKAEAKATELAQASANPAPIIKPNKGASGGTKFSFGGFAKADFIASRFSDGEVAGNTAGRDYYVPAAIPVAADGDSYQAFDIHAKETRFNFATETPFADGNTLSTLLEFDFMNDFDGDERVVNGYSPHVRHAFIKYGTKGENWIVGQTWSNFQDVASLPDALAFLGPSEGTVFVRQAQARYTNGRFSVSIENPETTLSPFGGGARQSVDDDKVPDATLRFTEVGDWGHFTIAGLLRQLRYDNNGNDDTTGSWGVSLAGKFMLGDDDLRYMLTTGNGIGRYLGINTVNDAVYDSAAADAGLETIDETGGFIAYRHLWNANWRSSLYYSALFVDNDTELTGLSATESVDSWHVNLVYAPHPQFDIGVEYMHAKRELENDLDGTMDRLQFVTRYSFQ